MTREVVFTGWSGATWRYWTDQILGTPGAFGRVYAAEGSDGAPMAVKEVQKRQPWGAIDERLLYREIDIGRRVSENKNDMLLPVIDAADIGDSLLLVMTRAGDALTTVTMPMAEPDVISVMTDITTGLLQLHSIEIMHRDLKPANVLRHADRWKLADFGFARDQEIGTQDPTFIGAGTPLYMAPEIWEMKSPTVKTDLYALGCLGFELLTAAPPYIGEDRAAVRVGHLTQAPPDFACGNVQLKNLITRLIAKDPADRPQDARAVLERLQRASLPRNRIQEAIAHGVADHTAEKARAAADLAAAAAAHDARRQQIAQARADLHEIINDALEDLRIVDPDATCHAEPGQFLTLATADAKLRIDIWDQITVLPPPGDTMIVAACVLISNRRSTIELNIANLVYENLLRSANLSYEQSEDRFGWYVYQYHAAHPQLRGGLDYNSFFSNRKEVFAQKATRLPRPGLIGKPLTSDILLGLFQEAVDLRPSDLQRR